ncbi:MAG: hypothetical protein GX856_06550 [Gammaproteobacteria bacterium]|nr:hypothetical protein [Gammaproteobacteria bacterium]
MRPADAAAIYAAMSGPHASGLAAGLGEVGNALAEQLARLEIHPDPQECVRVARNLEGAARAVMRLRNAMEGERR